MSKKRVSGAWVDDTPHIYNTSTDTFSTLPHEVIGDGTAISSYTIKGNMTQSGTPTPSNPIYPTECGDKTANLFDYQTMANGEANRYLNSDGTLSSNNGWAVTDYIPISGTTFTLKRYAAGNSPAICLYDSNKQYIVGLEYSGNSTVTISANTTAYYARFSYQVFSGTTENLSQTMLVEGSTAPSSYIPFGYKIPILSNGNTYPIYLSEPIRKKDSYVDTAPSTGTANRVIKKYEITGNERMDVGGSGNSTFFQFSFAEGLLTSGENSYCSHFQQNPIYTSNTDTGYFFTTGGLLRFRPENVSSTSQTDFVNWLKAQYAAGTPVTVWYVLATATTESFTAPTIPTSGTAQSFDVDTTLKPSEVSLTWHGWHEHEDTTTI